jgi:predicted esterase
MERRRRSERGARGAGGGGALGIVGAVLGFGALIGGIIAISGDAKAAEPKPNDDPGDDPVNPADPPKDPPVNNPPIKPPAAPPVDDGENWGATPLPLRAEFLRAEKAAGIPGLARFMAVWSWGAFRAGQPAVTQAQAAAISAANPEWCRLCHNTTAKEREKSKEALDRVTLPKAQGGAYDPPWPKVTDYAGWTDGSYGLFDVLAGAHAHDGIHNSNFTPLVKQPAASLFRVDVQLYIAGYMVYRIVYRQDIKVLVAGNPAETWANIRGATAAPAGYIELTKGKNTAGAQAAASAKANCLMRASELGIDLGALPMPMPWSWPGAKAYWNALGVLANQGQPIQQPENPAPPALDPALPATLEVPLANNIMAHVYTGALADDAEAPLVVVLHGRDADWEQMGRRVDVTPSARFAFLSSPTKTRWFDEALMGNPALVATQIQGAAANVLAAIQELQEQYPATTSVNVVGYSQGAAIAYQFAATGVVAAIVAVAGYLPPELRSAKSVKTKVWAVAGQKDKSVPIAAQQGTYESFILSSPVQGIKVVANGDHGLLSLTPAMNAAIAAMVNAK